MPVIVGDAFWVRFNLRGLKEGKEKRGKGEMGKRRQGKGEKGKRRKLSSTSTAIDFAWLIC